jgi:hypothetical protein
MPNETDVTLEDLKKILSATGLEFYVKKQKDCIVKVHFMVREEDDN